MNRTDRLHALAEELRRAGSRGRTAAYLSAWLEVSTRTIKRDVSALQQAGVPIWAQAGPGGGYVLDAKATLPPVNLTPAQAVAIATALAAQAARPGAPWAADGRAALEKVLDVMHPADRRRAEDLGARVWLRGSADAPGAPAAPSTTAVVEQALAGRTVLALDYEDGEGRSTRRRVEPHLLARTGEHWHLIGWCRQREAPRWFRLDRIRAAHLTDEVVPDRDLAVFGAPPADAHPVRQAR
ncbi:MAG: WYL domain-containing protein [Quadrisphaera sp.]